MARRNPVKDALIAEAKTARRAAGQKATRLKRQGIRAEDVDPRQGTSVSDYSGMSSRQLRQHIGKLRSFTSRETQFVAGDRGAPIKRSTWNRIVNAEKQANLLARVYEETYGNVNIPGTGMDIAGRMAELRKINRFSGAGQRRTFEESKRQAKNITGQEAAEDIADYVEGMLKPGYLNQRMRTQRQNLETMLTQTGDDDALRTVKGLTNNQLNLLIDYTPFMTIVGGRYAYQKSLNVAEQKNPKNHWTYSEFEDNAKRLKELTKWAGTLPKSGVANRDTDQSTEYTDTNARLIATQQGKWTDRNTNVGSIPVQQPAATIRTKSGTYEPAGHLDGETVYRNSAGKLGFLKKRKNGTWKFY